MNPHENIDANDPYEPLWCPRVWTLFDESDYAPPRVLVVEPEAKVRLQIGHALRQAGMDADFAASTEQALSLHAQQRYDVAVVNPEMDAKAGAAFCRKLSRARSSADARTPVITLRNKDSVLNQLRNFMLGAQASLVRPLACDHFIDTVWRTARG